MPDVAIVGGGIIGAACAQELAARGASVTLIERDELAAGASGRNQGWFVVSPDPACGPMSRLSLQRYLALADTSPVPIQLDRQDVGHVLFAIDERGAGDVAARAAAWTAAGIRAERLDGGALAREEPGLAPDIAEAWMLHHGRRVDPAALTVAHALGARELGAQIHRHTVARALVSSVERVTGVVTDDGLIAADTVILAAGPWSAALVRPLGIELPVTGSRGWIVELAAAGRPLRHLVEEEDGSDGDLHAGGAFPSAAGYAESGGSPMSAPSVAALLHPASDGGVVCGASHHPAIRAEPDDTDAPQRITERAIRVLPALADATVRSIRWGIRPMSPDDRPIVGWIRDGLLAATGHGAEGVILGGGTAALVGAIVSGEAAPFDPAPFDPSRF